jgi:chloramphenicol-sensitive protein RarD
LRNTGLPLSFDIGSVMADGIVQSSSPTDKRFTTAHGFTATVGAFTAWGLFPLYFHPLSAVPALQITAHRVSWACLITIALLAVRREWPGLLATLRNRAVCLRLAMSATLISINWTIYAWAVTHGHVVESSLGYFINPLVNVLLGVVVLSERLTRAQWIAVAIAGSGVAYLTVLAGNVPWIAVTLAISFGLYGLVRKITPVEALLGLTVETLLIAPLAFLFLLFSPDHPIGAFEQAEPLVKFLLVSGGVLTVIPLVLFAMGTRLLPYSTVGLLQYIAPTLQLLIGVFVFGEPFLGPRVIGFVLIWVALVVYGADGLWRARIAVNRS